MINIIQIKDLDAPELQIYYNLNEAQLFHYFEPKPGDFHCGKSEGDRACLRCRLCADVIFDGKKTCGDTGKRNPCAL